MQATIGRIVYYKLSAGDVDVINQQLPVSQGRQVRNSVHEGDVLPAIVVAAFGAPVNLQVFLDGQCSYWATSRSEGENPGSWAWPPRA